MTLDVELSAEVRWFWAGNPPQDAADWFHKQLSITPPGGGAIRKDEYLLQPSKVQLGLKKRGGKPGIEVKGLIEIIDGPDPLRFDGCPKQRWAKWGAGVLTFDTGFAATVSKRRFLRKYDADTDRLRERELRADDTLADSEPRPVKGCNVELTTITFGGEVWSTLGVEAFGGINTVMGTLDETLKHLASATPPPLVGANCWSYPEWLEQVRKGT